MAETIASGIVDRVQRLGVDGVDFMQAEGCGIRNMRCDDQTSTHLFLLELIRKKMPKGKYKYLFHFYTKKYSLLYNYFTPYRQTPIIFLPSIDIRNRFSLCEHCQVWPQVSGFHLPDGSSQQQNHSVYLGSWNSSFKSKFGHHLYILLDILILINSRKYKFIKV